MRFKELPALTFDTLERYCKYYEQSDTELADAAPISRFAWSPGYGYRYLETGDLMTLVSDGGVFTRPHFCLPLGVLTEASLDLVFQTMNELFQKEGWPLCAMFLDEHHKEDFAALAKRQGYFIEWDYNDDLSDYLYKAENLRKLRGKKYRSKRNHVNKFFRLFPDAEYRPLTKEMKAKALALVEEWSEDKDADIKNLRDSDYLPIKRLFDHFDELDIRGGAIFLGENLLAFAMGSFVRGNLGMIHFEKANPEIEGLYAVINQWVVEEAFAEAEEINREEDMGIEGMRLAKQSYHPSRLIRKMRAYFFPL